MREPENVVLGVPYPGGWLHDKFVRALLEVRPSVRGIIWYPGALLTFQRNAIVSRFLEQCRGVDYLLFVDSDTILSPATVSGLVAENKDIIGALYAKKGQPSTMVAARMSATGTYVPIGPDMIITREPVRVDYVGTGCLMVHRRAFEAIPYPWFEMKEIKVNGRFKKYGEDVVFCQKAQQVGLDVWVHCGQTVGHIQDNEITYPVLQVDSSSLEIGLVIGELAQFLGISVIEAQERVNNYHPKQMAEEWTEVKPETAEEMGNYYKVTNKYLYDLIYWNHSPEYRRKIQPLLCYRGKKILDVGAGIGSLCITLANQDNQLTYYDINEQLAAFAAQRFQSRHLPIKVVHDLSHVIDCDVVTAIDTLEHIHEDELPALLEEVAHCLKPGGVFYEWSNFGQQYAYPMHQNHSKSLTELAEAVGLVRQKNGEFVKGDGQCLVG